VVLTGNLKNNFFASFALGWAVTITAGLASYPLDTVRRRMMMTSGEAVKYKSSWDCAAQVIAKEGVASLFKGAGANVLRGIAGAGVLSGFDKIQEMYINWRVPDAPKKPAAPSSAAAAPAAAKSADIATGVKSEKK